MPRPDAAALLCRSQDEHHSRGRTQVLREMFRGKQDSRYARLHVRRSPAEQLVAIGFARKRVEGPLRRSQGHRIDVAGEAQRRLRVRGTQTRDDAGALVGVFVVLDRVTPLLEQAAQAAGAVALVARGIDRIELEQVPRQRDFVICVRGQILRRRAIEVLQRTIDRSRIGS